MSSPLQSNSSLVLSLRDVSKSFGREQVLKNLSLEINAGSFTLLLGQNGSGKSTLLRLCAGLSRSDGGTINRNVLSNQIGYVGHQSLLYAALTVRENLELAARLLKLRINMKDYLADWQLNTVETKRITELSKGLQFRVALARALIHAPRLILLDEPTSALDESSIVLLLQKLKQLMEAKEPSAVLVASHDISRLQDQAKRAVILTQGLIAVDSSTTGEVQTVVQRYRDINR